jgi:hypothetical protein
LSSHKLCPRLWSSCVAFIAPPAASFNRPCGYGFGDRIVVQRGLFVIACDAGLQ